MHFIFSTALLFEAVTCLLAQKNLEKLDAYYAKAFADWDASGCLGNKMASA